jgi:hypothetical protein
MKSGVFALFAALAVSAPAIASDAGAQAQVTWTLGFGAGHGLQTGYGLAIDYRGGETGDLPARLLQLEIDASTAIARIAGMPLYARTWRLEAQDGAAAPAAPADATPWFARKWVFWTAGSLALTAALAGGGGSGNDDGGDDPDYCTGVCYEDQGGYSVASGNINGPGRTDVCVADGPGLPEACVEALIERPGPAWLWGSGADGLDAGTGGMGDLVAR